MTSNSQICGRCRKQVYQAEKKVAVNKVWHQFCFNCVVCHKILNVNNFITHKGEIFCQQCYAEATSYEFDLSGLNKASSYRSRKSSPESEPSKTKESTSPRSEILESSNLRPSEIKSSLRKRKKNENEEISVPKSEEDRTNTTECFNRKRRNAMCCNMNCPTLPEEENECKVIHTTFPSRSAGNKVQQDSSENPNRERSHRRRHKQVEDQEDSAYETENNKNKKNSACIEILPSYLCKGDNYTCPKNAAYSEFVYEDDTSSSNKNEDRHRKHKTAERLKAHNNEENNIPTSTNKQKEEIIYMSDSGNTKLVKVTTPKMKKRSKEDSNGDNIHNNSEASKKSKVPEKNKCSSAPCRTAYSEFVYEDSTSEDIPSNKQKEEIIFTSDSGNTKLVKITMPKINKKTNNEENTSRNKQKEEIAYITETATKESISGKKPIEEIIFVTDSGNTKLVKINIPKTKKKINKDCINCGAVKSKKPEIHEKNVPCRTKHSELVDEDSASSSPKSEEISSNKQKEEIIFTSDSGNTKLVKITMPNIKKKSTNEDRNMAFISDTAKNENICGKKPVEEIIFLSDSGNTKLVKISVPTIKTKLKEDTNKDKLHINNEAVKSKKPAIPSSAPKKTEDKQVGRTKHVFDILGLKKQKPVDKEETAKQRTRSMNEAKTRQQSSSRPTPVEDRRHSLRSRPNSQIVIEDITKLRKINKIKGSNENIQSIKPNDKRNVGKTDVLRRSTNKSSNTKLDKKEANQKTKDISDNSHYVTANATMNDTAFDKSKKDNQNKRKSKKEAGVEDKSYDATRNSLLKTVPKEKKTPKHKKNDYISVDIFKTPLAYSTPKRDAKLEKKNNGNTKEDLYKTAEEKSPITNVKLTKKKKSKEDLSKPNRNSAGGVLKKTKQHSSKDKTKQFEDTTNLRTKEPCIRISLKNKKRLQSKPNDTGSNEDILKPEKKKDAKILKEKSLDKELFTTAYNIYPLTPENRNIKCQTAKCPKHNTYNEDILSPTASKHQLITNEEDSSVKKNPVFDNDACGDKLSFKSCRPTTAYKNTPRTDSVQTRRPCTCDFPKRRNIYSVHDEENRFYDKNIPQSCGDYKDTNTSLPQSRRYEETFCATTETNYNVTDNIDLSTSTLQKNKIRNRVMSNCHKHTNGDLKSRRQRSGACSSIEMVSTEVDLELQYTNFGKLVKKDNRLYNNARRVDKIWANSLPILKKDLRRNNSRKVRKVSKPVKKGVSKYQKSSFHDLTRQGNNLNDGRKTRRRNREASTTVKTNSTNVEYCRRCCKKVFLVERLNAENGIYHTYCFSCLICQRHLDSLNVVPRQGEIFCKQCYMKFYGPHTYGFGMNPNLY